MNRICILMLILLPFAGHATDVVGSECAVPGRYNEEMLFSSVTQDLGITSIERGKTSVEVLSITPVSEVFARQLAQADSKKNSGLSEKDYFNLYYKKHVLNLTAKYTYTNGKGQRDIFIASSLLNDDECSVRFNGYLMLSRDF